MAECRESRESEEDWVKRRSPRILRGPRRIWWL